jgi:hypothetical protein
VLAWSADSSNFVGAKYIIMGKAAGTQLVKKWDKMSAHNHITSIKNLCVFEAELASVRVPAHGALYLREYMFNGEHNTVLDDSLNPSGDTVLGRLVIDWGTLPELTLLIKDRVSLLVAVNSTRR